MLRDNLVGLIEPTCSSAGANPLALFITRKKSSDDRSSCLENPRPDGAESTLTENAPSPFHAEPEQNGHRLCGHEPGILYRVPSVVFQTTAGIVMQTTLAARVIS